MTKAKQVPGQQPQVEQSPMDKVRNEVRKQEEVKESLNIQWYIWMAVGVVSLWMCINMAIHDSMLSVPFAVVTLICQRVAFTTDLKKKQG